MAIDENELSTEKALCASTWRTLDTETCLQERFEHLSVRLPIGIGRRIVIAPTECGLRWFRQDFLDDLARAVLETEGSHRSLSPTRRSYQFEEFPVACRQPDDHWHDIESTRRRTRRNLISLFHSVWALHELCLSLINDRFKCACSSLWNPTHNLNNAHERDRQKTTIPTKRRKTTNHRSHLFRSFFSQVKLFSLSSSRLLPSSLSTHVSFVIYPHVQGNITSTNDIHSSIVLHWIW